MFKFAIVTCTSSKTTLLLRPLRFVKSATGHRARCPPSMSSAFTVSAVEVTNPQSHNFILGHAHFIQTVDDLAEICARHSVPKYGVAFCEASQGHDPNVPGRLVRTEGNDDDLVDLAAQNALSLGAGHTFIVFIQGAFPISILNSIKSAPTVCRVYCATANPTTVLLTELEEGRRGILGVVDGMTSIGIESEKDKEYRKNFLRAIGYKR